jgi:hypothetical protein
MAGKELFILGAFSLLAACCFGAAPTGNPSSEWHYKDTFWAELARAVPQILRSQDAKTGRFGSGIWIVTDQNVLFPLAVAWGVEHPKNPYYHRDDLLRAILAGGDALIEDQDERGMWEFRKKDGSTWGKIYMPWTYSRWIRAFGLIRDAMPPDRRARWERALTLGYEGIAKTALSRIHNIPTHHAMGLYRASQILNRPEWCEQAKAFMAKVCAAQNPGGYWTEHQGPVVIYNFVYSDAMGAYYAMSGDATVLPALERAAQFHAAFTYPDGSAVETVDERNPYHADVRLGTVGFTFSPSGRGFGSQQWQRLKTANERLDADTAAAFILYGQEGSAAPTPGEQERFQFVLGNNEAVVHRQRPWFVCLSAFHSPVEENRWIQDRQNFVSVFHDRVGLIVGGGNTKLQPLWSAFTVGDTALLSHRPGDTAPKFTPPPGLWHVPTNVQLNLEQLSLALTYGPAQCRVKADTSDPHRAALTYEMTTNTGQPVEAHVTLLPRLGGAWKTASGKQGTLDKQPLRLAPGEAGAWFEHNGWRISVPPTASVVWHALPHNPYRKDGHATPEEGRIVLVLPFSAQAQRFIVTVEVP